MKKIVWFVFLCCIMVGQPVWAQNKVTEQQKVEYDKGNRDQKFLKEYIEALKADGQTETTAFQGGYGGNYRSLPLENRIAAAKKSSDKNAASVSSGSIFPDYAASSTVGTSFN